ncbi:MAG TPA: DUF742 domain-containing protein [Pseudonocardia sp.]|jgi:hypothetical protein|nr:DUF742 domain-containing protein [Pseudonocardia sp.]
MTADSTGSGRESEGAHRSPEPTFADVMNSFSFDSGRSAKRRRKDRKRGEPDEMAQPEASFYDEADDRRAEPAAPAPAPVPQYVAEEQAAYETETSSAAVRPYAWTRGRTRSGYDLQIETLVSTSARGRDQLPLLTFEYRSVAQLCERTQSVAEVAALLEVPLGVAKVLLGDMAGQGLVVVHRGSTQSGNLPDLALMERVLSGLRRL